MYYIQWLMIKLSLNLFVCRQVRQKGESISEYYSAENALAEGV